MSEARSMLREVARLGNSIPRGHSLDCSTNGFARGPHRCSPGATVRPDSIILELSDLQLQREALDASISSKGPKPISQTSEFR